MTPLERRLVAEIAARGPLTVAEFMTAALTDPEHGYYRSGDPLGQGGDFTTAPEISQMFGELLGLWIAHAWQVAGAHPPFRLAELGPGRGSLMADALRAMKTLPQALEALELHLVEVSAALRRHQAERLSAYAPKWHDDVVGLAEGPLFVLANEFFDALPVRQFEKTAAGWRERLVALDSAQHLAFTLGHSDPTTEGVIPPELEDAACGKLYEVGAAGEGIVKRLAKRIVEGGGAALIVDYGYGGGLSGYSLQAVRGHQRRDPLARPGETDLSVLVNFDALARTAEEAGCLALGPLEQGTFLRRLGLEQRRDQLLGQATTAQAEAIKSAYQRLTEGQQMGSLFKVLALLPPGRPAPPGFQ